MYIKVVGEIIAMVIGGYNNHYRIYWTNLFPNGSMTFSKNLLGVLNYNFQYDLGRESDWKCQLYDYSSPAFSLL